VERGLRGSPSLAKDAGYFRPLWGLAPVLFGCMTFVMSVAGHQVGRTVAHFIDFIPKINTDLLTGACFALMAILMAFGVTLPLSYG